MKVRMLQAVGVAPEAAHTGVLDPGAVGEVPDELGAGWIEAGLAEAADRGEEATFRLGAPVRAARSPGRATRRAPERAAR